MFIEDQDISAGLCFNKTHNFIQLLEVLGKNASVRFGVWIHPWTFTGIAAKLKQTQSTTECT